jgi:hypothetical protein
MGFMRFLAAFVGCSVAAPPAPQPIAPPAVHSAPPQQLIVNEDAVRKAPVAAIVRVDTVEGECSDLGGVHVVFTAVEPGLGTVFYGGHGVQPSGKIVPGALFVAAVYPGRAEVSMEKGWCVTPSIVDGIAVALLPVDTIDQGRYEIHRLRP